jgi:N-ethylmaleimide reductase
MAGDMDLFSQYRMGDLTLPNRIVMAPMTRNRAEDADVPVLMAVTYYVQRASAGGKKPISLPKALKTDEVPDIVKQFRQAAENARIAGFDGVEIHGANGYLLDQFLRSGSNKRTEKYGGSLENRARLPLEVAKAVIEVWGSNHVSYLISSHNTAHSMSDANPQETFSYFTSELNKIGLGYLHLIEPIGG